ncbi:MAG: hypothetical protein QM487_11790 [Candidatus Marithrix sp.]
MDSHCGTCQKMVKALANGNCRYCGRRIEIYFNGQTHEVGRISKHEIQDLLKRLNQGKN